MSPESANPGAAAVLAARGFTARLGDFVLGPVDLEIGPGEVHALLGPNGSGKTTLIRACLGLLPATSGGLELFGQQVAGRPADVMNRVGYVPDDPEDLVNELTAPELWELAALARTPDRRRRAAMADRAAELAAFLDFESPRTPISAFSHGMRKKTQMVAALMHEPDLIILDEPRNGLDPLGILRLEALMARSAAAGDGVLVSSHDLHWAARVADRVHILQAGRVLASGPPGELLGSSEASLIEAFLRLVDQAR